MATVGTAAVKFVGDNTALMKTLRNVEQSVKQTAKNTAQTASKTSNRVEQMATKTGKSIGKSHQAVMSNLIALTGALATLKVAFKDTTQAAVDFEFQLAKVATMLTKNTMGFMPAFGKALVTLSEQFGQSTETLSNGLYDILSAQVPASKALKFLTASTQAAVAGFAEASDVTKALLSVMKAYKIGVEDVTKVSDKLFTTVFKGRVTFADLSKTVGNVVSSAAIAGMSLDDFLATVATVSRIVGKAGMTMSGLTGIIKAIIKPSAKGKEVMDDLGITINSTTLRAEGMTKIFQSLKTASTEQLAALFGNIRGFRALAAAMQDLGGFDEDLGDISSRLVRVEDRMKIVAKTARQMQKQLVQTFNALKIAVGDVLLPEFKSLLVETKALATSMKNFVVQNKEVVKSALRIGLLFGGIITSVLALKLLLPLVTTGLLIFAGAVTTLDVNTKDLTQSLKTLTEFITFLISTLTKNFTFGKLWDNIITSIGFVMTWIGRRFSLLLTELRAELDKAIEKSIVSVFKGLSNVLTWIDKNIVFKIDTLSTKAMNSVIGAIAPVFNMIRSGAMKVFNFIAPIAFGFVNGLKSAWNDMVSAILNLLKRASLNAKGMVGTFISKTFGIDSAEKILELMRALNKTKTTLTQPELFTEKDIATDIKPKLYDLPKKSDYDKRANDLLNIVDTLGKEANRNIDKVGANLKKQQDDFTKKTQDDLDVLRKSWENIFTVDKNVFKGFFEDKDVGLSKEQLETRNISKIKSLLKDVGNAVQTFTGRFTKAFKSVEDVFKQVESDQIAKEWAEAVNLFSFDALIGKAKPAFNTMMDGIEKVMGLAALKLSKQAQDEAFFHEFWTQQRETERGLLESFADYTNTTVSTIQENFTQSMTSTLQDVFALGKSWSERMTSLWRGFWSSLYNSFIEQFAKKMAASMGESVFDFIGSLFGGPSITQTVTDIGKGTAVSAIAGSEAAKAVSLSSVGIPGFATGGVIPKPSIVMAGEAGKERVLSSSQTAAFEKMVAQNFQMGSQRQPNVAVNVNNNTNANINAENVGLEFDGKDYILNVVLNEAQTNPNFSNAFRS